MGIKKLNRDILKMNDVWTPVGDTKKLVLDGMSILYYIWTKNKMDLHRILNNMDQYKYLLENFINSLINKNYSIELIIFDGATEPKKLVETIDRQNKRLDSIKTMLNFMDMKANSDIYPKEVSNVLQPLIKNVFIEKLDEIKIPYYFSSREADQVTADEAKKRNAIAVSNDSDYYFFDIPEGYIPVFFFDNENPKVYKRDKLMSKFSLDEEDLLNIAKLMGNDYCKEVIPIDDKNRLNTAIKMVKSDEELCINNLYQENINIILPENKLSQEKYAFFSKGLICSEIIDVMCGMPFICPVTFEDLNQKSSWIITRPIRNQIYSYLNLNNVTEGIIKNNKFVWDNISVNKQDVDYLNIKDGIKDIFIICLLALVQLDDTLTDHQIKSLIASNFIKIKLVKNKVDNKPMIEDGFTTVKKKKNKKERYKYINGNFEIKKYELKNCTRESIHILAKWRTVVNNILILGQITENFYVIPTDILSMTSFHRILKDQNLINEYLNNEQILKLNNIYNIVQEVFPNKILKHNFPKKIVKNIKESKKIKYNNLFTSLVNEL